MGSRSEALQPEEFNLELTLAGTEYEQELPAGTKAVSFQARTAVEVRFSFFTGKVATPTAPYSTLKANQPWSTPEKAGWGDTSAVETAPKLYFASDTAATVMEIIAWKART